MSPMESPGPWAGTVTHTGSGRLVGMVSQEKWDKTKCLLEELKEMATKGPLPLQRMLEIRGFFMYVVRTYTDTYLRKANEGVGGGWALTR